MKIKYRINLCTIFIVAILIFFYTEGKAQQAKLIVPLQAQSFRIGEVKLLASPFKISQDAEAKYLLSLDLDKLVAPFRKESGLTPKATAYPGWETNSLPGVAASFYLSGAARLYKLTGREIYLNNMNYVLAEMELCQKRNNGYLLGSKNGLKAFTKLENEGFYKGFNGSDACREPYYVMEKLFSGLIDAYRICNNARALNIATNLADWLEQHMAKINEEELEKIMSIEYGGLNWVLADLYIITGNHKYLEMSKRWQDKEVVIPIVSGRDILTGIHANTQFPKMSGLVARYPYTADSAELTGAKFFWDKVVNHRSYATGGNSESEMFCQDDSMRNTLTPFTEENCNEYNMLKLTSLLYNIEPKIEYADYMERTLFNHILAAQNPADGKICYFLPLMPGAQRRYESLLEDFSCCVCSAMDSYTRHGEYIYAHTATDLIVNLFIPSVLNWKEKGISLKQETNFPYKEMTTLKFVCSKATEMGLMIRNPGWLSKPMVIKVNGKLQTLTSNSGYYTVKRTWNNGDIIELKLSMGLRTESMADDKNTIAFFHGPVLLAGILEKDDADKLVESRLAPALLTQSKPFGQWLKMTGNPMHYITTVARPKQINLKPLFELKSGHYSVYWQKITEKDKLQRIAMGEKKKQELKRIEDKTIDKIIVGDYNVEKNHSLSGNSTVGYGNNGSILTGRAWRVTTGNGSYSYEMKVTGDAPVALVCKFMGREPYEEWNCKIKVDTTTIAELNREKDDTYPVIPFEYTYQLPTELTKGKGTIKVSFEGGGLKDMPRLMELRTIKR